MKTKHLFGRALSAVFILFGFTAFAWAGCNPADYECIDISEIDDSHSAMSSIVKGENIHNQEIPNDGKIPSDPLGNHLGIITYGGTGTNGVGVFGGLRPTNPDGSPNKWYDENGKKQLIEFSNIDLTNVLDQNKALDRRFGGHGTYVFGDVVTAGESVIQTMPGDVITDSPKWEGGYINNGGISGAFNSSKDKIRLPKGVTKDDIIFARLYWFGHIFSHGKMSNITLGNSNCDANDNAEAAKKGVTCKRLPKVLEISEIAGYHDVKLKVEDGSVYPIKRENCQGNFAFNSSRRTSNAANPRYNMNYTCSADITDKIKENFKDYDTEINIAVGDITATKDNPHYQNGAYGGNMVWSRSAATVLKNPDDAFIISNTTYRLPFGGWYVVLVYDKSLKSQSLLKGVDFPQKDKYGNEISDDTRYSEARKAGIDGDVKKYIDTAFKPKNVTIYDGYLALEPPIPAEFANQGITKTVEECAISVDYDISGFFTPKSGDVQGKFIIGSFGANRGNYIQPKEGIFVAKDKASLSNNRLPNNKYNTKSMFNGSKTWLEIDDDDGEYELEGDGTYHQALDKDEFDISEKLGNSQSQLSTRITMLPMNANQTNRAFIPFIGVSIDIYVPKICYEQKMYDTKGWLGFYNADGTPIDNHGDVEDVHVVTGENLYYRTEFRNKNEKDSEDAEGVWVKVNTGRSNTYITNSSGINNNPSTEGLDGLDKAKFVFLQDNTPGAYSTQAKRAGEDSPDVTDSVYSNKQLNSVLNRDLKFYIGRGAGVATDGEPTGGALGKGESIYAEFNASVGRTMTYTPIRYTVGYSMKLGGSEEAVQGPQTLMDRCDTPEQNVEITLLNGLKVVNQNFKDYGTSETDKNKTLAQDDRLFTQVAELPFDVNMIFKPDINDVFRDYCVEKDSEGKCFYHSDDFDICENYGNIFVRENGKCRARTYTKLPDGTWGIKYLVDGKLDGTLQDFPLEGNLYLSAIRAGSGCRYIDDRAKLPFLVNGERYMTDYLTGFKEYQNSEKAKVMPIEKVEFEDAFDGVTFMFSYYPRGVSSPDMNTTGLVDENGTFIDGYGNFLDENGEPIADMSEYYIYMQTQILYAKYIKGYRHNLTNERKKELVDDWYASTDPKIMEDRRNFQAELDEVTAEIRNAKTFFGVEMSPDGSFHVCDSDSFVVRPAYFQVDMEAARKYAKLINTEAEGDITKGITTKNDMEYRIGGDYRENTDVLAKMFFAKSNKNHPVPNYHAIIGGDLGSSRFSIRKSYGSNSVAFDSDDENATTVWRANKTYLKPFISSDCYGAMESTAFFVEKELKDRANKDPELSLTNDYECANTNIQYTGFEYENGSYKFTAGKVDKEDSDKQAEIGTVNIDKSCMVKDHNGVEHIFAEYFTRIWDKNGVSLFADFGVREAEIEEGGYAKIKRISSNALIGQGLLEPKNKSSVPAVLYTGKLFEDNQGEKVKGYVFDYFNVGDVLVSVYDNSWTDAHGDQTFDERKGPDGKYWGTTCVINSTSNEPITATDVRNSGGALKESDIGKVGCDIGMENSQELVLRFRPDRINLALAGLGTVGLNTDATGANGFVYYNSPDIPNDLRTVNGVNNKSMINNFANLGRINFTGEAYLSDLVFKNTIATLYDGAMISGEHNGETYEVARCGFASDMDVTLNFSFNCDEDPTDQRCATNAVTKQTAIDIDYAPYVGESGISYTIPTGTTFMTDDSCRNNNGISDSRCFRYNVKSGFLNAVGGIDANRMSEADRTVVSDFGLPLPINLAVNYYTDAGKTSGFINQINATNNIYDPKNPLFVLLARAFDQGATRGATIYLNFDRMQKSAHLPLYIFATDFAVNALDINETIEPAKFNKKSELVNTSGVKLIAESGKFTGKPYENDSDRYENFNEGINETSSTFVEYAKANGRNKTTPITEYLTRTRNVPAILFAYGKANEVNNGAILGTATYEAGVAKPIRVNILDALFCDRVATAGNRNGCIRKPSIVLNGEDLTSMVPNIFAALNASNAVNNNGFITNNLARLLGTGTTPDVRDIWVAGYFPDANTISIPRNNPNLINGVEAILIQEANNQNGTNGVVTVEVLTRPWLIYTPFGSNVLVDSTRNMLGASDPIQYYNYFTVSLINIQGQWGGEGEIKGTEEEGDIGSFITGKDFEDIGKGENESEYTPNIRNDRIDW